jgi:hypothetical protein
MASEQGVKLSEGAARTTAEMARWWRKQAKNEVGSKRRHPIMDEGGGCDTQNAIIDVIILGKPTGGSFDMVLTINATTETLTFQWDDTSSDVDTELATHSELSSSDVDVSGSFPNSTVRIEFVGTQANTNIALPTTDWSGLTGGTGTGIICVMAQLGHA